MKSKFVDAVEHGLQGLKHISTGPCPGCKNCADNFGYCCVHSLDYAIENGEVCDEGGFSRCQCECCGSTLGGNRYAAHGVDSDGKVLHLEVCPDCVWYIANGDEPEEWEQ